MKRFLMNRTLRALVITNGIILLAAAMLGPIYALFVKELGGNILHASATGAILAITAGITVLISGRLADKTKDDRHIIVAGYALAGLAFLSMSAVSSIGQLFAAQMLLGFGQATYGPAFDKLYSTHLDKHKEAREWSIWSATFFFTTAIGAMTGGYIVTQYGFTPMFVAMGALCFASAAYLFSLPKKLFT